MCGVPGGQGGSLGPPGGVRPCQPGASTPEPSSETTDLPSADTVAVPLITRRPVVWSKDSTLSCVPGAAPNTFGKLIFTGAVKVSTPGAWIVMSKVCWITPSGSMSFTSSGGTVLTPILTSASTRPSTPTAEPGATVSVSALRCSSVNAGADFSSTVIVVATTLLTGCSEALWMRGR